MDELLYTRTQFEALYGNPRVAADIVYLSMVLRLAAPGYSCCRPPGASGALLLLPDLVIFGMTQPPDNSPDCKQVGCEMEDGHCVRCLHAEHAAILTAARYGYRCSGTTIYSLLKPCYQCTKAIIAAGIERIVYAGAAYDEGRTRAILAAAGVKCDFVDIALPYGHKKEQ